MEAGDTIIADSSKRQQKCIVNVTVIPLFYAIRESNTNPGVRTYDLKISRLL